MVPTKSSYTMAAGFIIHPAGTLYEVICFALFKNMGTLP